jgi:hypothetical protein
VGFRLRSADEILKTFRLRDLNDFTQQLTAKTLSAIVFLNKKIGDRSVFSLQILFADLELKYCGISTVLDRQKLIAILVMNRAVARSLLDQLGYHPAFHRDL